MDEDRADYVQESLPTPPVDSEIWKLILDRSQIPEILIHTLKGEVWVTTRDADGKATRGQWEQRGEQLMNETGIRFFSSFLYSAMSPDKLATSITEEEVKRMARDMTKAIIILVAERGAEFGIADANRTYIIELLDHFYFSNLTASRRGTILKAINQGYTRTENYVPRQQGFRMPDLLGGGR